MHGPSANIWQNRKIMAPPMHAAAPTLDPAKAPEVRRCSAHLHYVDVGGLIFGPSDWTSLNLSDDIGICIDRACGTVGHFCCDFASAEA